MRKALLVFAGGAVAVLIRAGLSHRAHFSAPVGAVLASRRAPRSSATGGSQHSGGVRSQPPRSQDAPGPVAGQLRGERLTAREAEGLRLIAAGKTNKEIADELAVSPATVQRHVANIYQKIGARNRAQATAYAVSRGGVDHFQARRASRPLGAPPKEAGAFVAPALHNGEPQMDEADRFLLVSQNERPRAKTLSRRARPPAPARRRGTSGAIASF